VAGLSRREDTNDRERPARSRDSAYMRRALALARKGWGQTAPNPMVGAVVVRDGRIVATGYHARWGGPHAEAAALADAGPAAEGSTVYVTLEPCAHVGNTPPCADALVAARVARVVYAAPDPTPVAGGGAERLRAAGIEVVGGVEERAARELNAAFFHAAHARRPWVTLKLAVSIDGALTDATRTRAWLTGARARREVHRLRAGHDAVAVGIGTALADDPLLTVRGVRQPRVPPTRVVFDRRARLPAESALARTAREIPTLVVAERPDALAEGHLRATGVEVLSADGLADALDQLRERGVRSLFVEGGAELAGAFWDASLVDRLIIFQAPIVLGAGAVGAFTSAEGVLVREARRLPVIARRALGDDLMTTYAVSPNP
jgi:diaminohydroxyphosphoribosylaminopyrimidine deaminase / 5-amino-6-(5-phosphoribosylamino)uracil reductase